MRIVIRKADLQIAFIFIFFLCCLSLVLDIPGIDIPDLKDIPIVYDLLHIYN